jgi:hypothetical protein
MMPEFPAQLFFPTFANPSRLKAFDLYYGVDSLSPLHPAQPLQSSNNLPRPPSNLLVAQRPRI